MRIRTARMAMTTRSSMRVRPEFFFKIKGRMSFHRDYIIINLKKRFGQAELG